MFWKGISHTPWTYLIFCQQLNFNFSKIYFLSTNFYNFSSLLFFVPLFPNPTSGTSHISMWLTLGSENLSALFYPTNLPSELCRILKFCTKTGRYIFTPGIYDSHKFYRRDKLNPMTMLLPTDSTVLLEVFYEWNLLFFSLSRPHF